jgi:hypothetical protein
MGEWAFFPSARPQYLPQRVGLIQHQIDLVLLQRICKEKRIATCEPVAPSVCCKTCAQL